LNGKKLLNDFGHHPKCERKEGQRPKKLRWGSHETAWSEGKHWGSTASERQKMPKGLKQTAEGMKKN